jgi:DNA helicase-2/ATP-dependent DNA helicase PcrA
LNDIFAKLNDAQRQAVTAPDGPVLVVAGAGSGKTRVLTTRIAWLLAEKDVMPGEILAFTFTNRAAGEMRERVANDVGPARAPFWIGTFHATGLKILRADGEHVGVKQGFSIFDTDDQKRLLKQVLADLKIDPKQFTPQAARGAISAWKNEDISPERAASEAGTFVDEKHAEIYAAYVKALTKCNALDFDDLILKTVHLLEQVEQVRLKYAARFRHVLVDEFQDTNPLQMVLVKLLTSHHGNLFVVGDDDQSIYSWRGARIENMLNFEEYFSGAVTFRLEQNYRSTGNILNAANGVIANNKKRKGKNLWTSGSEGDLLTEEEFFDDEDEAARLVDIVKAEVQAGRDRSDVTVLYRTNAQSRVLEDALRRASLPYQIVMVANPADQIAIQRVINVPKRKIGDTTVGRLVSIAAAHDLTLGEAAAEQGLLEGQIAPAACKRVRAFFDMAARWRMLAAEGVPVPDLLSQILDQTAYEGFLEADDPETAGTRTENVAEFMNAAAAFHESSAGGSLNQFLEQIALVSDPDTIKDGQGAVRLMTIHTAKGLEFPVVVLAGVEDDILPHINSAMDDAGLEEERRLFYVALTRAERRIYLLHAARRRRFGTWQDSLPSRFLAEVPDNLIERRHLDSRSTIQEPVARSLFGGGGSRPQRKTSSRTGSRQSSPVRAVRPEEWGKRQSGPAKPVTERVSRQAAEPDWIDDVVQDAPFYEGQIVSHGIFGTGTVSRVEGHGDDMMVTVDFHEAGRKHINPRFAPLIPVD